MRHGRSIAARHPCPTQRRLRPAHPAITLSHRMAPPSRMATMLGQILVDDGATTVIGLEAVLAEQRETGERLGVILV